MRQELKPELQQQAQEIEILLSNDFEVMELDELNFIKEKLDKLWGMQPGRDDIIYLTDAQTNQRDFLWFRITQEEHKDDNVKIGDLFYASWGYDQTNKEMFKVVGFTKSGKSALVRQIGMTSEKGSEGYMCDSVIPDPDYEIKVKNWDEEKKQYIETDEHLPDLRVKITRSSTWNPRKKEHQEIGETHLRGSVYYGCGSDSKHLQTLFKIKAGDSTYRSWYA